MYEKDQNRKSSCTDRWGGVKRISGQAWVISGIEYILCKGHCPVWNIVFSWLWPRACFNLTLLFWNWKKLSPKVIEAKKYELNRQNNSWKSQNFTTMANLNSWPPVNKSDFLNCDLLQSLQFWTLSPNYCFCFALQNLLSN